MNRRGFINGLLAVVGGGFVAKQVIAKPERHKIVVGNPFKQRQDIHLHIQGNDAHVTKVLNDDNAMKDLRRMSFGYRDGRGPLTIHEYENGKIVSKRVEWR